MILNNMGWTLFMVIASAALIGFLVEFFYRLFKYKKIIWPKFANVWMYVFIGFILFWLSLNQASWWQVIMAILVLATAVEYLTGFLYWKYKNIRLWDYSDCQFNYQGLVCLRFSIYWLIIGLIYYYFLMPWFINQ